VVKGVTAFAEKDNACIKDTGVYLPPAHSYSTSTVDVVLWFHGYYVQNARDLMHPDDAGMDMKLRQAVLDSNKDVILIAPWLGLKSSSSSGRLALDSLGQGDGCQTFLEQALDGIARFQKTLSSGAASSLNLGNLVLAGHSAGGAIMREAAKHLGKLKDKLRECWGFDCFYDDLYPTWIRDNPKPTKYFYFAHGSGGAGSYAFNLMKQVYGTPKKRLGRNGGLPNVFLAPDVDRVAMANDEIAFQTIADIFDWGVVTAGNYTDIRKATDVFLDDSDQTRYWRAILPKLAGHFQCVRDTFGPRIKQSQSL
jgi:hypothetical protein